MAGRAQHVIQKRVSLGRGRVGHAGTVVPRVYACFTTIVISPPPSGGPSRICLCSITSQCTISSAWFGWYIDRFEMERGGNGIICSRAEWQAQLRHS